MGRRQATLREGIGEEQRHYAQALRDVRNLRGETQQELGRLLDSPSGGGHRGYAAMVDGSGSIVACCCSHSIGGR
jgi:hypothetical protein